MVIQAYKFDVPEKKTLCNIGEIIKIANGKKNGGHTNLAYSQKQFINASAL